MQGLCLIGFLTLIVIETAAQGHNTQVPVFKFRKDSLAYAKIPDTLYGERRDFLNTHAFFYRTVYHRSREFTAYSMLPGVVDKDSVTQISIEGKKRLPDSLYLYKNLAELELINCRISRLPKELLNRPSLTKLIINNNFPRRRLKLPKSPTVTTLIIRGDEKGKLPRSYRRFSNLEVLQLPRNNLKKFPNLAGCDKLVTLDLNFNSIKVVPGSVGKLRALKSLVVNNNKVGKIKPGIEKLHLLEDLSFYKNNLRGIPPMLYTMTSLRMVDLYGNHIPYLSPKVANWKKLEIFYIANNDLRELPEEIGELKNLRELYIHHNMLSKIPASIGNLTSLHVLRMNNNLMNEWPSGVTNLKDLTNLDCSYNELKVLPIKDLDFRNLKILVIENNPWDMSVKKQLSAWTNSLRKNNNTIVLE
jgi:leucine-rich repeat protein SHOC2